MESKPAVLVALVANLGVAITKFVVAVLARSSAMLSEGVHSAVDTADQIVLLVGQHRSRRPPDEEHPFGHGQELYFWTLVVAVMIFGVGGGVSFYEGLMRTLNPPRELGDATWSYVVLGAATLLEGISWAVGARKMNATRAGRSFWRTFRESKDPALLTVVVEDSADLLGLLMAFLGTLGSRALRMPVLDGIASMAIGLLLASVSLLLVRESHSLLVGETAGRAAVERMRGAISGDPAVAGVGGLFTMQLAPDEILVNCEVQFRRELSGTALVEAVDRVARAVRRAEPAATRVFVEARAVGGHSGPRANAGQA